MKRVVRFMLYERAWKVWLPALLLVLLLLLLARWASGGMTSIAFDETNNTNFAEALNNQPPLPAIAAAREVNPAFETAIRQRLAETANRVLRSGGSVDLSDARPASPQESSWMAAHVCDLEGWGDHRAVIRKLVSQGFGNCGWTAKWRADSPAIYDYGGLGWLLVLLLWILFFASVGAAILLFFTRRAHEWLYASKRRF